MEFLARVNSTGGNRLYDPLHLRRRPWKDRGQPGTVDNGITIMFNESVRDTSRVCRVTIDDGDLVQDSRRYQLSKLPLVSDIDDDFLFVGE